MNRLASIPVGILTVLAGVLLLAPGAMGQELERIEDGTSDVNPLDASSRIVPIDLRQSNDFTSIFEIHGQGEPKFVRFAGGLAAVFPRSVYLPTTEGVLPDVPPDTTFYIGGLPEDLSTESGAAYVRTNPYYVDYRRAGRVSMRVDERARAPEVDFSGTATRPVPYASVWEGDEHRRRRVSQLLRIAADVELAATNQ
jgi:hypothetical protein